MELQRRRSHETLDMTDSDSENTALAADASTADSRARKGVAARGALIVANTVFGLGSIVGALGLPATNPLAFTFVREIIAGPLLLGLAYGQTLPHKLERKDAWLFAQLGFLLFVNQAGYILGILMAGPVMGSVWQPTSSIFVVVFSVLGGMEPWNPGRASGVMLAVVGCLTMTLLSTHLSTENHHNVAVIWMGNAMFMIHCCGTAGYILLSKRALKLYPALTVTGWSYNFGAAYMLVAALLSASLPTVQSWICPSCSGGIFHIPQAALPALTYYVLFQSVLAWGMVLWANQHATGTLVVSHTLLQPITAIVITTLLLATHLVASCEDGVVEGKCLKEPTWGTLLGIVGVTCGLYQVVRTEPKPDPKLLMTADDGYESI